MKEALLYEKLADKVTQCRLCAHRCHIQNNKYGFCGVRYNKEGVLYSLVYAKLAASNIDPIEKKPLYHFLPGSRSFSIATVGCNFRCQFCQNWEISQVRLPLEESLRCRDVSPHEIVNIAVENKCESVSYTYTEPTIFFEYAYETAKLASQKGLYNNFVTNGYMSEEAFEMINPYLDAANIDLKFFNDGSYRKICSARLQPVLDTIRRMKKEGKWIEITTLVIPGLNDSEKELNDIAGFIAEVDKNIPWHISRFYPNYKAADTGLTPEDTLRLAEKIGRRAGLKFIYIGNVYGWGNDTFCPHCEKVLIRRTLFDIIENNMDNGVCVYCKNSIPGVFKRGN